MKAPDLKSLLAILILGALVPSLGWSESLFTPENAHRKPYEVFHQFATQGTPRNQNTEAIYNLLEKAFARLEPSDQHRLYDSEQFQSFMGSTVMFHMSAMNRSQFSDPQTFEIRRQQMTSFLQSLDFTYSSRLSDHLIAVLRQGYLQNFDLWVDFDYTNLSTPFLQKLMNKANEVDRLVLAEVLDEDYMNRRSTEEVLRQRSTQEPEPYKNQNLPLSTMADTCLVDLNYLERDLFCQWSYDTLLIENRMSKIGDLSEWSQNIRFQNCTMESEVHFRYSGATDQVQNPPGAIFLTPDFDERLDNQPVPRKIELSAVLNSLPSLCADVIVRSRSEKASSMFNLQPQLFQESANLFRAFDQN